MRTPNASCIICEKPLYRRPYELARVRYTACMAHRAQAQSVIGVTEAQKEGLARGRTSGTNHRNGRKDTEATRQRRAETLRQFYAAHPEKAVERGAKKRGALAYNWKGGTSRLNTSIRLMHEHRKWMDAVKDRDGKCLRCGSAENLEAHHKTELAELLQRHGVTTRDQARETSALWDLENGETLCRRCHYAHHGRTFRED